MVRRLTLTVIDDNEPGPGLENRWGWSILLESDSWRILFDADTDPHVFANNVKTLGIDLWGIDVGFLSHHHYDHYGGYEYVGRARPGLTVIVPPGDSGYLASWGLSPHIAYHGYEVLKDAWTTGPLPGQAPYPTVQEQALAVNIDGLGLVVVVGCSHPGVDNLVEAAWKLTGIKPYMVIGGFHAPPRPVIDRLASMVDVICPAHCSGRETKKYVEKAYPDKACKVRTGSILRIDHNGVRVERY